MSLTYTNTHLGDRLRQARRDASRRAGRRITQDELADRASMSRVTISLVERRLRDSMPIESLAKVSEFLQVDFWWLSTGGNERPRSLDAITPASDTQLIEIIQEISAISGQIVSDAKSAIPVARLTQRLDVLCKEYLKLKCG